MNFKMPWNLNIHFNLRSFPHVIFFTISSHHIRFLPGYHPVWPDRTSLHCTKLFSSLWAGCVFRCRNALLTTIFSCGLLLLSSIVWPCRVLSMSRTRWKAMKAYRRHTHTHNPAAKMLNVYIIKQAVNFTFFIQTRVQKRLTVQSTSVIIKWNNISLSVQ